MYTQPSTIKAWDEDIEWGLGQHHTPKKDMNNIDGAILEEPTRSNPVLNYIFQGTFFKPV